MRLFQREKKIKLNTEEHLHSPFIIKCHKKHSTKFEFNSLFLDITVTAACCHTLFVLVCLIFRRYKIYYYAWLVHNHHYHVVRLWKRCILASIKKSCIYIGIDSIHALMQLCVCVQNERKTNRHIETKNGRKRTSVTFIKQTILYLFPY